MPEAQRWRRLGRVLEPSGQRPWLQHYGQNPVSLALGDSVHRVYFASRDSDNRAHIGFVDLEIGEPFRVLSLAADPALEPGPLGNFDDHGVYPCSVVSQGDRHLLYYVGVSPGSTPPLFYASIGLAVSEDGGRSFERISPAPVMQRSEFDPCLVSAPCVLVEDGLWRMWYLSCFRWERKGGSLASWYHTKYAESRDGIHWERDGRVCIDHAHPGERNIARPCVVREGDRYRAWFSYAGDFPYRIGYAESADGYEWTREDELVRFEDPAEDWDSSAKAYPWVFTEGERRYMLYCGNEIGREGFGLAVSE